MARTPAGNDYARTVADGIIEQLRTGTAPWTKPWDPGERFLPYNPTTGKEYHGGNALWLLVQTHRFSYTDARWLTYRQAMEAGAAVKKGEHGTRIQFWQWSGRQPVLDETGSPKLDGEGNPVYQTVRYERPRVFTAVVFNASQVEGLPPAERRPTLPEWERHQRAEAILEASGADIRHLPGDHAYYSLTEDRIVLPERQQFRTADGYYAAAMHELGHWTGHETRLRRDLAHPFGSAGYAREELRAEIASLMLGDQLAIGHDPARHAAYVGSWIRDLEDDPRVIFRASADAEKIVAFTLALVQERIHQPEPTQATGPVLMEPQVPIALERSQADATEDKEHPVLQSSEAKMASSNERIALAVPYKEKDAAKAAGARWDRARKVWYAPPGVDRAPLAQWLPATSTAKIDQPRVSDRPTYLAVQYRERTAVKVLGARWDKGARAWFVPPGTELAPFDAWIPPPQLACVATPPALAHDVHAEFAGALRAAGLQFEGPPVMDGVLHRVPVEGDRYGETSGAYKGHLDGHPAGYYENFKTGHRQAHWKSGVASTVLTAEDRARLAAEAAQHRHDSAAETDLRHTQAADEAASRWARATPAADHPYLADKGVGPGSLRTEADGNLLIPIQDREGKIWSLQTISSTGRKSFLKHGRLTGNFYSLLGPPQHRWSGARPHEDRFPIIIAEGYATAATVARLSEVPVVAAFTAGNIPPVAQALRDRYPQAVICIASDNDHQREAAGKPNVGREKAEEAARVTNGYVLLPPFSPGAKGTDWNDLAKDAGDEFTRVQLTRGLQTVLLHASVPHERQRSERRPSEDLELEGQKESRP